MSPSSSTGTKHTTMTTKAMDHGGQPNEKAGGVFEKIARSEVFRSEVHESVFKDDAVLEIKNFRLWYGQKQALHSISMQGHGADWTVGLWQVDVATFGQSLE